MKKLLFISGLAVAVLASCSKTETAEPQQKEIAFSVAADKATKAPLEGTTFADGQKIYVSAYNSVSGKYFEGVEFSKGTDTWKAGKYWPVNGVTSFLAYAATDAVTATWGDNYADKVSFDLADGFFKADATAATPYTDLLYANGEQKAEKDYSTIPMTFKHAGAWVLFNVKLNADLNGATVNLDKFQLANIFKGGKFTVDNTSYTLKADWDFTAGTAADYDVESFTAKALSSTDYTFGAIIPEQAQTSIKFQYTLSGQGFDDQTVPYEHFLNRFEKWEMGKKYVYNINISLNEIEIEPSVSNWDAKTGVGIEI